MSKYLVDLVVQVVVEAEDHATAVAAATALFDGMAPDAELGYNDFETYLIPEDGDA